MMEAAKEKMFSAFVPWCDETRISARTPRGEKPHQGVASKNPALHQGQSVCNSTIALGLRGQAALNRIGSRCTGKERDSESGLDYFGARYYSNGLGRWVSADWSPKPVPVPFADPHDPQTLNQYAYVRNNPLSKNDPDGHCGTPSGLGPGQVGICVASYISSNTVGGIGRGDGRGPNGQGGTSRIETRLVVDPSQHTATKTNETINRSGIILKDVGPQGKGGSTVSSTQTDKEGNTYFQVSQDAHSSYSMGGAVLGSIDNHLNMAVTPDGKVGIDPGSSAKDFPSLEVYKYTVDDKGNVTTTQVFTKQESGHVSDLKQPEKPIKPQEPK
jgi:RHS repeat-associated protein